MTDEELHKEFKRYWQEERERWLDWPQMSKEEFRRVYREKPPKEIDIIKLT